MVLMVLLMVLLVLGLILGLELLLRWLVCLWRVSYILLVRHLQPKGERRKYLVLVGEEKSGEHGHCQASHLRQAGDWRKLFGV